MNESLPAEPVAVLHGLDPAGNIAVDGRPELVPVRIFGQAVHIGSVFNAVVN